MLSQRAAQGLPQLGRRHQVINPEAPTFGDRVSPKQPSLAGANGRGVKRMSVNLVDGEENQVDEVVSKATVPITSGLRRPPSKNGHLNPSDRLGGNSKPQVRQSSVASQGGLSNGGRRQQRMTKISETQPRTRLPRSPDFQNLGQQRPPNNIKGRNLNSEIERMKSEFIKQRKKSSSRQVSGQGQLPITNFAQPAKKDVSMTRDGSRGVSFSRKNSYSKNSVNKSDQEMKDEGSASQQQHLKRKASQTALPTLENLGQIKRTRAGTNYKPEGFYAPLSSLQTSPQALLPNEYGLRVLDSDFIRKAVALNKDQPSGNRQIYLERREDFVNENDLHFLSVYGLDYFVELVHREKKNRHFNLMQLSQEFAIKYGNRIDRAKLIDEVFGIAGMPEMQMADKQVVFQTISYFDRFYSRIREKFIAHQTPASKKISSLGAVRTYNDFLNLDISQLSPEDIKSIKAGGIRDMRITGFTSLFVASKNSEVEPLSMSDLRKFLLRGLEVTRGEILDKEHQIRKQVDYENEVSTLFEYVMYYSKMWKKRSQDQQNPRYMLVYNFMCEVETAVYDLSKSVLIDAELGQYKLSVLVASLFTAVIQVWVYNKLSRQAQKEKSVGPPEIMQGIINCLRCWEEFAVSLFGEASLPTLKKFGEYVFRRQQLLYRMLHSDLRTFDNIYKERCKKYYSHKHFEAKFTFDSIAKESLLAFEKGGVQMDERMEFADLTLDFAQTITEVLALQG